MLRILLGFLDSGDVGKYHVWQLPRGFAVPRSLGKTSKEGDLFD
jgi:hypothetical protein